MKDKKNAKVFRAVSREDTFDRIIFTYIIRLYLNSNLSTVHYNYCIIYTQSSVLALHKLRNNHVIERR